MIDPEYFVEESYDNCTFVSIREHALLYSVEYLIEISTTSALMGTKRKIIFQSIILSERPTRTDVIIWLHEKIIRQPSRFDRFGIDVDELYKCVGGDPKDLYEG